MGVDVGWGRGSGLRVPRRPPPELPPRARPTGAASLACPCVHTRTRALTPACTRRPRAPAARARVGARPSLPPAAPGRSPRGTGLPAPPWRRGRPRGRPGAGATSPGRPAGLHAPAGTFARLAGVSRGHVPAGGHTRCSGCCASAPPHSLSDSVPAPLPRHAPCPHLGACTPSLGPPPCAAV